MTNEHEKAFEWRTGLELTREQLSKLVGYSPVAIYWFELGMTPPYRNHKSGSESRNIKPTVWRRYKMACAGVDAELRSKTRKQFKW